MSAPVPNGGPMVGVNLGSLTDPAADTGLTNALGHAAKQCAEKGSSAGNGTEAKDFGAAALSYVQALMAIVAPKVPQGPGGGAQTARNGSGQPPARP